MMKIGASHHDKTAKIIEREMADDERLSVVGQSKPYRRTPRTEEAYSESMDDIVVLLGTMTEYLQRIAIRFADAKGSWPAKELIAIHKTLRGDLTLDEEELGTSFRRVNYDFSKDIRRAIDKLDKSLNTFHRSSVHTRSTAKGRENAKANGSEVRGPASGSVEDRNGGELHAERSDGEAIVEGDGFTVEREGA
jgi:hypothetical protein